ncbi:MAG: hypothetical protein KGJ13_10885, partial [Patescibacteria group bacterium]|nr:hypothetical protein [Patescibacteria group bacterium]
KIYLDMYHDKPLWACAVERFVHGNVRPEIIYVHGRNETEARTNLGVMKQTRIVAIGRAIGYFVQDTKGEVLSV